MMQNDNLGKLIDDAAKLVNNNSEINITYKISKKESKKFKKTKKLIIKDMKKFALTIAITVGVIIVMGYALMPTNTYSDPNKPDTTIEEPLKPIEEQLSKYINKYCEIYGINKDIAKTHYEKYKKDFIEKNYFKKTEYSNYNLEIEVLSYIRHLYQKPEDFGLSESDVCVISIQDNEIFEEKIVKYYSDLFGVDPALALAIEYHESTKDEIRYNSDVYINYNNPAGLISPETFKYWKFPSKKAGIIEHIYQLKRYYIDQGKTTPEQIKENYAPDNVKNDPNNVNIYWVESVKQIIEEINNTPDIYTVDRHGKIVKH